MICTLCGVMLRVEKVTSQTPFLIRKKIILPIVIVIKKVRNHYL